MRQALAFALDRVTLTEVATAGKGVLREIFSHPNVDYYATALGTVRNRYPYQLLGGCSSGRPSCARS